MHHIQTVGRHPLTDQLKYSTKGKTLGHLTFRAVVECQVNGRSSVSVKWKEKRLLFQTI